MTDTPTQSAPSETTEQAQAVQNPPPDTAPPSAGGRYTRDPATGALTLVTPSTVQE